MLLHDEELINVFQPPRVRARSCVVHRAQRHQPTRAENPCGWRGHRGYAFALSLSASVCPCVHRSVQQPCLGLFVGEERYRLVKEGNLLLGSLAKSERSSFDPALRDRFFEMTPPIKDIRKRSFTIFRFEYDYFRSI